MDTLEKIRRNLATELAALNECIASALDCDNELLNKVIRDFLDSKGKQIRPILVILSAKLFGEVDNNVISAAAGIELLHSASLIHDDVVDETKLRRGKLTVNAIWDNHIAVLAGDYFVSSALREAVTTTNVRIINTLASLGRLLSLGEVDQICNAQRHILDEQAYMRVISQKTASLFVACLEIGAFATGVTHEKDLDALRRYGKLLGQCFQIKDDIFDYLGNPAIGKPTGNDLREGKVSLPLLHVLKDTDNPRHDEMMALMHKKELSTEDIDTLISYAVENGGIEYSYSVMDRLKAEAEVILAETFAPCEATETLRMIFDYIITRHK